MLPANEITKSLPPLRDDEPPSLRQNIVDEILDHLRCSLHRELLTRGGDEVQAKERVLKKFGDPDRVARRLWFQAMWSTMMTQRLVFASTVCSMVVSIVLAVVMGLVIQQMGHQQREQQAFNAALIEKMAALIPTGPPRDLNWNHLEVKLTTGTKDGPPAEGVKVFVKRTPGIGEAGPYQEGQSVEIDKAGLADCGLVKPGIYVIGVSTSWNEVMLTNVSIQPGKDHLEQIVVPERMPELTNVSFQMEGLPDKPMKSDEVLIIGFRPEGSRNISGRSWGANGATIVGNSAYFLMVVPNQGVWIAEIPKGVLEGSDFPWPPTIARLGKWTRLKSTQEFKLPTNEYSLSLSLATLKKKVTPDDPDWHNSIVPNSHSTLETSWTKQEFAAIAGQRNDWTINLPPEVARSLTVPEDSQLPLPAAPAAADDFR